MRHHILLITILLATLIGSVGWINLRDIPARIILKPNTTLEQATTEFAQFNLYNVKAATRQELPVITSFSYTHKFEEQYSLSGAVNFEHGKDDITAIRNANAKEYSRYKKERLRELQEGPVYDHLLSTNNGVPPDSLQAQIDKTEREVAHIIENIDGCWDSNTCPPPPLQHESWTPYSQTINKSNK